jgi:hypothetical protein
VTVYLLQQIQLVVFDIRCGSSPCGTARYWSTKVDPSQQHSQRRRHERKLRPIMHATTSREHSTSEMNSTGPSEWTSRTSQASVRSPLKRSCAR